MRWAFACPRADDARRAASSTARSATGSRPPSERRSGAGVYATAGGAGARRIAWPAPRVTLRHAGIELAGETATPYYAGTARRFGHG